MTNGMSDQVGGWTSKRNPTADIALLDAFRRMIRDEVKIALWEERQGAAAQPSESVVYFIQAEDGGPIKIGVAIDPVKRLADLQRTSPQRLRILSTTPGGIQREKELHKQFADWRLHGEWFSDECEDLRVLAQAESEAVA